MLTWDKVKDFFAGPTSPPTDRYVSSVGAIFWAILIAAFGAALVAALLNLWPVVDVPPPEKTPAPETQHTVNFLWGVFDLELDKSTGLLVLSIVAGALGSFVQASLAFVHWVGNRELKTSWVWWYGFRIFSGAVLALIVYMGIRGGLFGGESTTVQVNPYGTVAFGALVGLFSKQAIAKLQDVFNTAFSTTAKAAETDPGSTPQEKEQGTRV